MEMVVTTGAIKSCKAPVRSSPPTNQYYRTQLFTGSMPILSPNQQSTRSTEGENITFHGLTYPKLTCYYPLWAGSKILKIDPLHFLGICRERQLNQVWLCRIS